MNDSGMLDGKIALITGAGGGIGRASAVLAAAAGAKAVVVADIQPAAAEETAHLVEGMGATAVAMAIDVSDPRSEEHTSELQSLMRISYAVFCLKKKLTD